MIKGMTKSGFAFELREELADDYELLELIGEVDENPAKVDALLVKLLGKEQKNALKEHLRGENGIVKLTDMDKAIMEIFAAFPQSKN